MMDMQANILYISSVPVSDDVKMSLFKAYCSPFYAAHLVKL